MSHIILYASRNWTTVRLGNIFPACTAPGHYLNQCWLTVNWTNFNGNGTTMHCVILENALEGVVCKMVAILSRERWSELSKQVVPCQTNIQEVYVSEVLLTVWIYWPPSLEARWALLCNHRDNLQLTHYALFDLSPLKWLNCDDSLAGNTIYDTNRRVM